MVRARPLAPLTHPAIAARGNGIAQTPDAGRGRLRLDFDGGPWLGTYPIAHLSPWVELVAGALAGLAFGLLRGSGPLSTAGWVLAGALTADVLQALVPTTFPRRVAAASLGAVPFAWLVVRLSVAAWTWLT